MNKRALIFLTAVVLGFGMVPVSLLGEPPPGYYDDVDDAHPVVLRETLHEVIDDHVRFSFDATWEILEEADEDPEDFDRILDVYKNASYPKAGGGNQNYEREHTWPSSYGFPDQGGSSAHTDCHALFLADLSYNRSRGRVPYRFCHPQCAEQPTELNHGRGGPSTGYPGNSNWREGDNRSPTSTWETWIGRRGDVARALFYMDVRYEGDLNAATGFEEPDLVLTNDEMLILTSEENLPTDSRTAAHMGILSDLLAWHYQDPVDELERRRNDVVFGFQGNRNPFVDNPRWAGCLFEGKCESTTLLLKDDRFRVTATWATPQGGSGQGQAVKLTSDTGYFWFFDEANVEVVVKVIDACAPPFDRFWVFAGGLTNVQVEILVEDLETPGAMRNYFNPQGAPFIPIQDTQAFDTCP